MNIELIKAKKIEPEKIMQFRHEFIKKGETSINGSRGLHHFEKYEDWLEKVLICENENNDILGVASTLYFAIRENDRKVVGCIELRHSINEELRKHGGHIGYSVLPVERRKGYATEMLHCVIEEAKKFGIDKLLLTCNTENIGSQKTILNCGGVLEKEGVNKYHEKEIRTQYYWINI